MKTLSEFKAAGYVRVDSSLTRGYVSRKPIADDKVIVHKAGGSRAGQYYYLAPKSDSTRYCHRVYLSIREE